MRYLLGEIRRRIQVFRLTRQGNVLDDTSVVRIGSRLTRCCFGYLSGCNTNCERGYMGWKLYAAGKQCESGAA